jgi:hypothetical protein
MNEIEQLRAQILTQLVIAWKDSPAALRAKADEIIVNSFDRPPGHDGMVADHDESHEHPSAPRSGPPDHLSADRLRFRGTGIG